MAGSYSQSGGTFTVNGSGADIWDTADEFHFVYQQRSGDGTIIARVTSVEQTNAWAKAGIMIRESLATGSRHATMLVAPAESSGLGSRAETNGMSNYTGSWSQHPLWLKLERTGNTFTGYRSSDGVNWGSPIASVTISMSSNVYVGLAVTSHDDTTLCTSTFTDVSVNFGSLPAGWTSGDVGAVGAAGSASESGGTFTVNGSGADIWDAADEFHFVYQQKSGDGTIIARVTSVEQTNAWAKAAIMIRESLATGSRHATMLVAPAESSGLGSRAETNGLSNYTGSWSQHPLWLKLERTGNTFTGYRSSDGVNWGTAIASVTISMSSSVYVGLAVTSHNDGDVCTATFTNVSLSWQEAVPIVTATTLDDTATINTSDYAQIQVTRTGSTASPLTVRYLWAGTATTWDDYRLLDDTTPDNVTIGAGESSAVLTFKAVGTNDVGNPETAGIQITDQLAYDVGTPSTAMFNIYTGGSGPTITSHPQDQSVATGSTATFNVTATGTAPLQYQWRKNGADISGASNASLSISNAQSSDAGTYDVRVSNSVGTVTSSPATLAVGTPAFITVHPESRTVTAGQSASFSVAASGSTPLAYQWRKDGTTINGATNDVLTVQNTTTADQGSYTVVVSNAFGSQTSNPATLTVTDGGGAVAPTITSDPQHQTVNVGGTATFNVTATGTTPLLYQWRREGANLSGATAATLTLTNVQLEHAGNYDVVVTNSAGSDTSAPAALTVNSGGGGTGPTIVDHPRSQIIQAGRSVSFSVKATDSGTLSYQWRRGTTNIAGGTSATLTLPPADALPGTYYVIVSDAGGSRTSIPATLIVEPVPGSQPFIVEIRTAAPDVLVVVVQTPITEIVEGSTITPDSLGTAESPSSWAVNGVAPLAVSRYSIPWDEDRPKVMTNGDPYWPFIYPVTTRHRLYLKLNTSFSENTTYDLTTPYGPKSFTFTKNGTFCESIKLNQVGYSRNGGKRFANFAAFLGDGQPLSLSALPKFQVIDETTGNAIPTPTGAIWRDAADKGLNVGMENRHSGEHVYRLKLDDVPEGGPYYIYVENAGRSRPFGVGKTYSQYLAYVTMRGLYHQRCGMALGSSYTAWTHALCHSTINLSLRSTSNEDSVVVPPGSDTDPISGGYHDAGDMDHTKAHPQISINMLSFFEAFRSHLESRKYNIPESSNQLPDFLDEILWGVTLWEKLQRSDGSVMSGWSANKTTLYGYARADDDTIDYGTMIEDAKSTAYCAGIFAHTARLLRAYGQNTKADELLGRAKAAWTYLKNNGGVNHPLTHFIYASLQLYLEPGSTAQELADYRPVFETNARRLIINRDSGGTPREGYQPGNIWMATQTAHFISYLLPHTREVDGALTTDLKAKIEGLADSPGEFEKPGDTTPYPLGTKLGLGYGTATTQGRCADVLMYAWRIVSDATKKQGYVAAISQLADYSLGLNPMGMSYYTGLGVDQPNSPCDCNSYHSKYGVLPDGTPGFRDAANNPIGNVPGILVYGPLGETHSEVRSGERPVTEKLVPSWDELPPQRRYTQGWSMIRNNEYTTHETMVWNTLMYAFLEFDLP